jgi:hypothetical protein
MFLSIAMGCNEGQPVASSAASDAAFREVAVTAGEDPGQVAIDSIRRGKSGIVIYAKLACGDPVLRKVEGSETRFLFGRALPVSTCANEAQPAALLFRWQRNLDVEIQDSAGGGIFDVPASDSAIRFYDLSIRPAGGGDLDGYQFYAQNGGTLTHFSGPAVKGMGTIQATRIPLSADSAEKIMDILGAARIRRLTSVTDTSNCGDRGVVVRAVRYPGAVNPYATFELKGCRSSHPEWEDFDRLDSLFARLLAQVK